MTTGRRSPPRGHAAAPPRRRARARARARAHRSAVERAHIEPAALVLLVLVDVLVPVDLNVGLLELLVLRERPAEAVAEARAQPSRRARTGGTSRVTIRVTRLQQPRPEPVVGLLLFYVHLKAGGKHLPYALLWWSVARRHGGRKRSESERAEEKRRNRPLLRPIIESIRCSGGECRTSGSTLCSSSSCTAYCFPSLVPRNVSCVPVSSIFSSLMSRNATVTYTLRGGRRSAVGAPQGGRAAGAARGGGGWSRVTDLSVRCAHLTGGTREPSKAAMKD